MFTITEKNKRLYEKLCADLGGQILSCLENPDIHEVMLNPNGQLWVDSAQQGQFMTGRLPTTQTYSILSGVAGIHGLIISNNHPRLEAELPYFEAMKGERLTGAVPPIVQAPCFTIRKRTSHVFTLDDYIASKRITPEQANHLRDLVQQRKNILVCGGPGSGKTTLTNALIHEAVQSNPKQRFILLEDLPELQCTAENAVAMLTTEVITTRHLLHAAMRLRPDRILIGEVRGAEALDMLKAWNTGCPGGICTTHANGAEEALQRISDLTLESGLKQPPYSLLKHTLNAVVSVTRQQHQKGCVETIMMPNEHHFQSIT